MNLRRLGHAVALARTLNFTKAAESVNLTQSALSKSIQTLEAECQMRLFDRDRGSVTVTPVGRNFIRRAEALLREEADLSSMIHHASKAEGGDITIGMPPGAAQGLLVQALSDMVHIPDFHAVIRITGTQNLLALLLNEEIDFCVSPMQQLPPRSPIRGFMIAQYPVNMLVRAGHPLSKLADVSREEIYQYPIVMAQPLNASNAINRVVDLPSDIRPTVAVEDYRVLVGLMLNSDAVCMSSPIVAMDQVRDGSIVALPYRWMSNNSEIKLMIYHLRRRSLSPIARKLIERLRDVTATWDFSRLPPVD